MHSVLSPHSDFAALPDVPLAEPQLHAVCMTVGALIGYQVRDAAHLFLHREARRTRLRDRGIVPSAWNLLCLKDLCLLLDLDGACCASFGYVRQPRSRIVALAASDGRAGSHVRGVGTSRDCQSGAGSHREERKVHEQARSPVSMRCSAL